MSKWWPARQRLAFLAVATALLTGVAAATLGTSPQDRVGAMAYVGLALAGLIAPRLIALQMICGQVLMARLLLAPDGPSPFMLIPMVASVILTAEILALVGRMDTPVIRDPGQAPRQAAIVGVLSGGVFGAVLLVGMLPGPTGLLAVGMASAACVVLAVVLGREAEATE